MRWEEIFLFDQHIAGDHRNRFVLGFTLLPAIPQTRIPGVLGRGVRSRGLFKPSLPGPTYELDLRVSNSSRLLIDAMTSCNSEMGGA